MTNGQRLEHELTRAGRRGCTRRELESAGVTHVEIEVDRLRRRDAVVREELLPLSGQKRFILITPAPEPQAEVEPEPEPLFPADAAKAKPASPYDVEAA